MFTSTIKVQEILGGKDKQEVFCVPSEVCLQFSPSCSENGTIHQGAVSQLHRCPDYSYPYMAPCEILSFSNLPWDLGFPESSQYYLSVGPSHSKTVQYALSISQPGPARPTLLRFPTVGAEGVMQASIALGGRQGSGIQSSQSCRNCSFCIKEEILTKNVGSPEGQYGKLEQLLLSSSLKSQRHCFVGVRVTTAQRYNASSTKRCKQEI
eukprot:bmy_18376T0